jgi:hypothetical protein
MYILQTNTPKIYYNLIKTLLTFSITVEQDLNIYYSYVLIF